MLESKAMKLLLPILPILLAFIFQHLLCADELDGISNSSAKLQSAEEVVKKVCPAVVRIIVKTETGYVTGTGFFVGSEGCLVTNKHVVDNAAWIGVLVVATDGESAQIHTAYPMRGDEEHDLYLLKVEGVNVPNALRICKDTPKVLDDVVAVGFPSALDTAISQNASFNDGYTSDKEIIDNLLTPNVTKGAISKITDTRITHDAKISRGNSGGPLVDFKTGEVLGVNTMGINDAISSFFIAVPVGYVSALLARSDNEMEETKGAEYKEKMVQIAPKRMTPKKASYDLTELNKKAEEGDAEALYALGELYSRGEYVERDYEKAFFYLNRAAEKNNANAYTELGIMYSDGTGVPKDVKKAVKFWEKAVELGENRAKMLLALFYDTECSDEVSHRKAFELYKELAEAEESVAYAWLAECYATGRGTKKSKDKAKEYFVKAIESEDLDAKVRYADFLVGDKNTQEEGVKLMIEAADDGRMIAQGTLGYWYLLGKYVEEDIIKSIHYFTLAAKQGDIIAAHNLGTFYYNGQGVKKDLDKAELLLKESAMGGNTESWAFLARIYEEKGNVGLGIRCLQEGGRLGDPRCSMELALKYHFGKGVMPNKEQEIKWLRVTANQNENLELKKEALKLLRVNQASPSKGDKSTSGKSHTTTNNSKKQNSKSSGRSNKGFGESNAPKPAAKKW